MKTLSQRLSLLFAGLFFKGIALRQRLSEGPMKESKTAEAGKIYSFTMRDIDGKERPLSAYKGKVVMIVNTASLCGFTPQYDSLEALHKKYKDRGFAVLAFPANDFGAQEPGADAQIHRFCRSKFGVSFDLFSKIAVKGPGMHPLYRFLTTESGHNGPIAWNFAKFLVAKDGSVAARFDPPADPMSKKVTQKVEELLAS